MNSENDETKYKLADRMTALELLNTGVVSKSQIDQLAEDGNDREEFEENWRLGFKATWYVHQEYEIQEGELRSYGPSIKTYAPMAHKEIPGEMAKLNPGDEIAVLKFARSYGGLGYFQLRTSSYNPSSLGSIHEPLTWIWAHARNIHFCLSLTECLQTENEIRLANYLNSNFKYEPLQNDVDWYWSNIAYRDEVVSKRWKRYTSQDSLADFARYIRMEIINRNIVGIRREFQDVDGRDQTFFVFSALVEVAYWQLADAIMGNQNIIRCEGCDAPFVQTNKRQRFCPTQFRQSESACAVRGRVRKHRQRK